MSFPVGVTALAVEELMKLLDESHHMTVQRWLDRGDGCAVYENVSMGGPLAGHLQFVSYGSKCAQLEVEFPPERLPDIGSAINWQYRLRYVCRPSVAPASLEA